MVDRDTRAGGVGSPGGKDGAGGRDAPPPGRDAQSHLELEPAPSFEQLSLEPTVTGPRRRTEDLYEPGTVLVIKGERGTYVYRYASISSAGHVSLHLVGEQGHRAVRPDQVVPVRKPRGRR